MMMDDATLIRAAQAGCDDAWQQLYTRYQPRMHGLVRSLGFDDVQDICQDAWLNLARFLGQFDPSGEAPFWYWLAVVVKRCAYHTVRYAPRVQMVYDVPMVAHDDVAQTAIGRVFAMQLIAQLPEPTDRQILEWRVWHDLTFVEIGDRLNIHKTLARDYYERALRDLRGILEGIAPPEKHIHHAPGLSAPLQAECIRRYTSGEATVKQLAALYGVSPITMNGYVCGTKTITCARCGATDVRPGAAQRKTCEPCLAALHAAHQRWCNVGGHAVADGRAHGPCSACSRRIYERRRASGYYAKT